MFWKAYPSAHIGGIDVEMRREDDTLRVGFSFWVMTRGFRIGC